MYHHTDITIPRPSSMHFTMKKGVNFLIIGGYPISRLFISLLQIHVQFCGGSFFKVDNFEESLQVYIELMMDDYPN